MKKPVALYAASSLAFALAPAACGDEFVYRPLTVEIEGLSSFAQVLVLKVFPESTGETCNTIDISNVRSMDASLSVSWRRAEGADRELELPRIDEPALTVVVYTENAEGTVIQIGCTPVRYRDIEDGRVSLRLSARTASIMRGWRRSSALSSSSVSSGAAEWPRSSSREGAALPTMNASSSSGFAPISRKAMNT